MPIDEETVEQLVENRNRRFSESLQEDKHIDHGHPFARVIEGEVNVLFPQRYSYDGKTCLQSESARKLGNTFDSLPEANLFSVQRGKFKFYREGHAYVKSHTLQGRKLTPEELDAAEPEFHGIHQIDEEYWKRIRYLKVVL